jgi:hypothetical protein
MFSHALLLILVKHCALTQNVPLKYCFWEPKITPKYVLRTLEMPFPRPKFQKFSGGDAPGPPHSGCCMCSSHAWTKHNLGIYASALLKWLPPPLHIASGAPVLRALGTRLVYSHQSRSPSLRWEGTRGSGIIRCRKPGILARIELPIHFNGQSDFSLKRIIPEPHVPSRGSQARGTRLYSHMKLIGPCQ